jgi:hypothetical protein
MYAGLYAYQSMLKCLLVRLTTKANNFVSHGKLTIGLVKFLVFFSHYDVRGQRRMKAIRILPRENPEYSSKLPQRVKM